MKWRTTHYAVTCGGCNRRFDDVDAFDLHQPCPSGKDIVCVAHIETSASLEHESWL